MFGFIKKLFGDPNAKTIQRMQQTVEQINALEKDLQNFSDASLAAKTEEFKRRLGEGETLDDLLPEAFAVAREASRRVLGMRHFDVQLMGGMVLHEGNIAEMRTGEGKTLVATLPVYLNALAGKGVHVITVNDYLARRDSEWMGQLYQFLGLSVGTILHGLTYADRKHAYACDVTYGTNNEFGFDYLRDNMVIYADQMVQRPLNFAIVDEVDSILVDEARTPLIISGPGERATDIYGKVAKVVEKLEKEAGRKPTIRNGPRTLDLDIIFYGDQLIEEEDLQIPHPRLAGRAFVLKPLADLIPDFTNPRSGERIRDMLAQCDLSGIQPVRQSCDCHTILASAD